jgi:VanZ family protein
MAFCHISGAAVLMTTTFPWFSTAFFRAAFVLAFIFTTFMALVNPVDEPILLEVWDKLLHVTAFVTLAFLLDYSFPIQHIQRIWHPWQPLFLLGYGFAIEWMQSFTTYREASLDDVFADAVALLIYGCFCFIRHRITNKPDAGRIRNE